MSELIKVTDENFDDEVLKADRLVLVNFWAHWCNPCIMLEPLIEEIGEDYDVELKVCKLNVEENPKMVIQFKVMNLPTMIVFKNGEVINKLMGYISKGKLLKELELV